MTRYRLRMFLVSRYFAHVVAWFTGHRRRMRQNLKRIYPHLSWSERYKIEKKAAQNVGRTYAELMSVRTFLRTMEGARIEGPGVTAMHQAIDEGRPCIFATAHFANHLACIPALTVNGIEAGILYRRVGNPVIGWIFDRAMGAFGQQLFKIGRRQDKGYQRNLARLARHMRGGGHVGLLLDQRVTTGAKIPFLGHDAWTSLSIAELSIKYNAVFIPSYALRQPDGIHFRFVQEDPIPNSDPETMMRAFNERASAWITEHPGQWFWDIRRW
ncbi:MAG: lysophospholipid acyltransferase family protein [Pseudomonadota bacterium]